MGKTKEGPACSACESTHDAEAAPVYGRRLVLIGLGALFLAVGLMSRSQAWHQRFPWAQGAGLAVLLLAYVLVGGKVIAKAFRNLAKGMVFDENSLMTIASLGAIALRQVPEAVAVMLFYEVGEYLQGLAIRRSRRSIAELMDVRPRFANVRRDGVTCQVPPEEVSVGELIAVRPGERVPLDGEVVEGRSHVDTSALTGEPAPRKVEKGDAVLAGMVNGEGLLTVRVTKGYEDSALAHILHLAEEAYSRKARTEQFLTAFARYYTPAVVGAALIIAFLPPLVLPGASLTEWGYRALVLLVISCPCALMVSVPLGYFGGIGGASRCGILVKGANYLEALASLHTVVFDKTGTLTKGVFRVTSVEPSAGWGKEELLGLAAAVETPSTHPVARSVVSAWKNGGRGKDVPLEVNDFAEIPGHGVKGRVGGRVVLAGNDRLMHSLAVPHDTCELPGTAVHVAVDGVYSGYILISDEIKSEAARAVRLLKAMGVRRVVMLTGDEPGTAARVAEAVGVDAFHAGLLPEDKVRLVEEMKESLRRPRRGGGKVAFVGDGINDAPVIACADVGVAMGALGSDAAIEAADVVIMDDSPARLAVAVALARHATRIVRQNVALALLVKGFFLGLGAFGVATIWEAVFADVGVTLVSVLNATRAMRFRGEAVLDGRA